MPRLLVSRIVSVGAVAVGDNPEAAIYFYKSKKDEPLEGRKERGDMALDLSHLTDEDAEPIQAFVVKMEEAAVARDAEVAELKATIEGEDEKDLLPDDLPEPVAKALADRDTEIAKARTEAAEAKAESARLRDEKLTETHNTRAAELENLLGPRAEVAPVLKALDEADPENYAKLNAMHAKLIKWDGMTALLAEQGDSAATGLAVDQIAAFAKEYQKDDKDLTYADAKVQAWSDHPELKEQLREEQKAGA